MRGTSIVAAAVAIMLMLTVSLIGSLASGNLASRIQSFLSFERLTNTAMRPYSALLWRCDDGIVDKRYCNALLPPLRFIYEEARLLGRIDIDKYVESNLSYPIRRSRIPTSEFPILRIYMTDGAIAKLQTKRKITLSKMNPILLSSDNDWVRAIIIGEVGNNKIKVDANLRLKGDWVEHIKDAKKMSFRIKVENDGSVFGMSKFSIHDPQTRHGEKEALALAMHRLVGVLSPRYIFVDVKLNGQSVGIMALEEHFTKEMVESQDRRDGPIVAMDEDWMWRQWDRYGVESNLNLGLNDYPIKVFRSGTYISGKPRSELNMRASSILRDLVDGKVSGNKVFDLDLVSRWWIMNNIIGSIHGARFHNRRFYFNPISQRLEPIPFDNMVELPNKSFSLDFAVTSLLGNEQFRNITLANITKTEHLIGSKKFLAWLSLEQERYHRILSLGGGDISLNSVKPTELLEQLYLFSQKLKLLFQIIPIDAIGKVNSIVIPDQFYIEDERIAHDNNDSLFLEPTEENQSVQFFTHIRPFWFSSAEGADIEIKNLTLHPIIIHSIFFSKLPENSLVSTEITIPIYQNNSTNHVFSTPIDVSGFDLSNPMYVSYSYRSQKYTRPVILQFRNYDSDYASQEATKTWFEKNGVLLNKATKTITFGPGSYSLETRLETEKNWRIQFLPGTVLEFKQGARLKVNGPVQALGRADLPVQLKITSDPTLGLIGSWGGLLVVGADRESLLRHTHVTGVATQGFSERQDAHGLTGCVTFYKSNVRIEHSRFSGLQCEDALNIISSDFNIDHVEFVDSSADAFDSDFSTGTVNNSTFRDIVNDGIDVSGSQVQVSSSRFSGIQDKAISVGEGSTLDASELTVDDADTGVVSKDKSVVNIHNSTFKEVNNALMAYIKKEEWGPAEIHCDNCLFNHVGSIAVEQYASRITIDGQEVSPTPFSRKQLQIAGYVQ